MRFRHWLGLYPKSNLEQARAEMIVDCLEDMMKPTSAIYHAEGQTRVCTILIFEPFLPMTIYEFVMPG